MAEPETPPAEHREQLLAVLAEYIARDGAAPLLAPPVVPGPAAFPDPWEPTARGLTTLLRRLAWHAGQPRAILLVDERLGPPPTERRPGTHVELAAIREGELELHAWLIGEDDVAGTLAHELGVAHAALARRGGEPYRTAAPPAIDIDVEHDLERGSIATVYLGLGVLAANAAYQPYASPGRFNGAYAPLEYDVLRAGYLPMPALAYLLAVQAVVRGETAPPPGLSSPQRYDVAEWIAALRDRGPALRRRLGIDPDARGAPRPAAVPFADAGADAAAGPGAAGGEGAAAGPDAPRIAFRWRGRRTGEGLLAGAVLAGAAAMLAMPHGLLAFVAGGAAVGASLGLAVRIARCSTCAAAIALDAARCRACGATMYGDIASRAERLEAEERVLEAAARAAPADPGLPADAGPADGDPDRRAT